MNLTIQNLDTNLHILIFQDLKIPDLLNAIKVCKLWKEIIESQFCLSSLSFKRINGIAKIKTPHNLIIDIDLTAFRGISIKARNIFIRPEKKIWTEFFLKKIKDKIALSPKERLFRIALRSNEKLIIEFSSKELEDRTVYHTCIDTSKLTIRQSPFPKKITIESYPKPLFIAKDAIPKRRYSI